MPDLNDNLLNEKKSRTDRGFQLVEFVDLYGKQCSVQQSSLALCDKPGTGAIWIGVDKDRMHLNRNQVEQVVSYLGKWLEDGVMFDA